MTSPAQKNRDRWCLTLAAALIAVLALLCAVAARAEPTTRPAPTTQVSAYFGGGANLEAIVREIHAAKDSVRVSCNVLTSDEITTALIAAHERRVRVMVVIDELGARAYGSKTGELVIAGVNVWVDGEHDCFHGTSLLIDDETVIVNTGQLSTTAFFGNVNTVLVIKNDRDLADGFRHTFHAHLGHARYVAGEEE